MRKADDILNLLSSWVGFNEKNGTHKFIIDIYNTLNPLPRGYKMKYNDAWCAAGLSSAAIATGMSDLIGAECGCEQFVKMYKERGIWNENGTIVPLRGWVILYNWDDNTQPNDGRSDHIGIVENVKDGKIIVIECNYSNSVSRHTIPISWGNIRGYGMIPYDIPINCPIEEKTEKSNSIFKSNEEIAKEVIKGCWGNGAERKHRLEEAGYNYKTIQSFVNIMLKNNK